MSRSISLLCPIIYGEYEISGECKFCNKSMRIKATCSRDEALSGELACNECIKKEFERELAAIEKEFKLVVFHALEEEDSQHKPERLN